MACAIPWLALFADLGLTGRHQARQCDPFEPMHDLMDPGVWMWMGVPAAITFVVLIPFLRFPILRRLAVLCLWLCWMVSVLLLGEAGKV